MSITPTAGSATANRSGRCCSTAPTSRPPFEPPMMPSFAGEVYFSLTRYSATAMKSSNTFCFFSRLPALCHASPYSAPPRMLTVTQMPPSSSQAGTSEPVGRQRADRKAAVAVQHRGMTAVERQSLARRQEERHARAVLRGGEQLLRLVLADVERAASPLRTASAALTPTSYEKTLVGKSGELNA